MHNVSLLLNPSIMACKCVFNSLFVLVINNNKKKIGMFHYHKFLYVNDYMIDSEKPWLLKKRVLKSSKFSAIESKLRWKNFNLWFCFSESIVESWRFCRHRKYVFRNLRIDQFIAQHCTMIIPIEEKFVYGKLWNLLNIM